MYPRNGRLLNSRSAVFDGKKNPAGMYPRNGRLLNFRSAFFGGKKAPAGMYPRNGRLLNSRSTSITVPENMPTMCHKIGLPCSERFCHHCRSEQRWGAGRHVVWCGISLRIFWDGSRGVNSFIRKPFSQKKLGLGRWVLENLENVRCSGG